MEFSEGVPVYSADYQSIGRLTRLALEPPTKKITHLVIQRGMIFTTNYVLPLEMVEEGQQEGIVLNKLAEEVLDLPHFEETIEVPVEYTHHEHRPAPTGVGMVDYPVVTGPRYVRYTRRSTPEDTLALKAAARVVSEDHHVIGHLDTLYVDKITGLNTHILIEQGLLQRTYKRLPAFWYKVIAEDEIQIAADAESLKALPEYVAS